MPDDYAGHLCMVMKTHRVDGCPFEEEGKPLCYSDADDVHVKRHACRLHTHTHTHTKTHTQLIHILRLNINVLYVCVRVAGLHGKVFLWLDEQPGCRKLYTQLHLFAEEIGEHTPQITYSSRAIPLDQGWATLMTKRATSVGHKEGHKCGTQRGPQV